MHAHPNVPLLLGRARTPQCDQAKEVDAPGPGTHYMRAYAPERPNLALYPLKIGSETNWCWHPMLVLLQGAETELNVLTTQ